MSHLPGKEPIELPPKVLDYVEKISQHYEIIYSLPRIGCRVLAMLLLAPYPASIDDLKRNLRVSHGSISTNLNLLQALGYIERVTYPGERITYYRFLPRSRVGALRQRIHHYRDILGVIQGAHQELEMDENVRQNLMEMEAYAELAIHQNSQFIEAWEKYLAGRSSAPEKG